MTSLSFRCLLLEHTRLGGIVGARRSSGGTTVKALLVAAGRGRARDRLILCGRVVSGTSRGANASRLAELRVGEAPLRTMMSCQSTPTSRMDAYLSVSGGRGSSRLALVTGSANIGCTTTRFMHSKKKYVHNARTCWNDTDERARVGRNRLGTCSTDGGAGVASLLAL